MNKLKQKFHLSITSYYTFQVGGILEQCSSLYITCEVLHVMQLIIYIETCLYTGTYDRI